MNRTASSKLAGAAALALVLTAAQGAHAIDEYAYPNLVRGQQQLDGTAQTLNGDARAEADYGGHRARALELIRQARSELDQAAQFADNASQQNPQNSNYADNTNSAGYDSTVGASWSTEPTYDDPPPQYAPPPEPVIYEMPAPPPSPVGYWGHHPIPGGGWCLAEGPHVHNYEPQFYDQFRLVDGYFKFGEGFNEWVYAGPHPIAGGGWCNIQEPHRHSYRPEVGFIYDPNRRGYYYDREHAGVVRTEVIRAQPNYRPPQEVVMRFNHPPVFSHVAPLGTPRPQPWRTEHVIMQQHPAGHPEAFGHPGGQQNQFHQNPQPVHETPPQHFRENVPEHPATHEQPLMNHEFNRPSEPMRENEAQQHPMQHNQPPPQQQHSAPPPHAAPAPTPAPAKVPPPKTNFKQLPHSKDKDEKK